MITDQEFLRISAWLKSHYGIDMGKKKVVMNGRLENYIRKNGYKSFGAFMDALEADKSGKLERMLVNLLTTNHTFFMREFEHFEYFRSVVLPWLSEKESVKKDLRIWCGASSTGEEPYMIAMVLLDFFGTQHRFWDTKVLATDISTKVLRQALEGVYTAEQLSDVPEKWKRQYFRYLSGEERYAVTEELKREVLFRQFNLMNAFPFRRKLHVVFLRNVMIYFDEKTKRELVGKIYNALEPGGYLFIGTTETLDRNSSPFQLIRPSIFRK